MLLAGLAWGALAAVPAAAALVESRIQVPVRLLDRQGRPVEQRIVVTLFHDDERPAPYPLLILNHGRAPGAPERATLGRARYTVASTWLAGFGFMVAVPTRVGYGVSGGPDIEDSGPCRDKRYAPAYDAAVAQTLAVLATLRERPDVAKGDAVLVGQSFGGTAAIALAALGDPGIRAAINFAGGGGGNPATRPGNPCAPDALGELFAQYGRTARIPTLWIYAENDRYFGRERPVQWFAAFQSAGGVGEFVQLPPHGDDGHALFTRAPELWRPLVQPFLQRLGYRPKGQ